MPVPVQRPFRKPRRRNTGCGCATMGLLFLAILVFGILLNAPSFADQDGPYGLSSDWEYSKFFEEDERTRYIREDKAADDERHLIWEPVGNSIVNTNTGVTCVFNEVKDFFWCY